MKPNVVVDKSKAFSVRIIKLFEYLKNEKREFDMARQLLRSGTSIGANIAESKYAHSEADFKLKMRIALKEANETAYWLEILHRADYIPLNLYESLAADCNELIKVLVSIIKSVDSSQKDS